MDQRQFEATLADAEIRLRRLRTLYDQWFHGLERLEPRTQRADVDRVITELRRAQPRNTALRFRFNQLVQRYTTYNTYWQRITRQIEEGTYKRDVLRARRRFAGDAPERDQRPADGYELDLDIDIEAALDAARQSEPPAAAASGDARPRLPSSRPPPGSERPQRAREITPFALPSASALAAAAALSDSLRAAPVPRQNASLPPANRAATPPAIGAGNARNQPPPTQAASAGAAPRKPAAPPAVGAGGNAAPPPGGSATVTAVARANNTPAQRAAKPAKASQPPSAAAKAGANHGVSDDQIQGIYMRYLDARRQNQERTDNVKLETVAKTVRDMLPKLAQKHAGKRIDFEVVVKDGRVALKPVAK